MSWNNFLDTTHPVQQERRKAYVAEVQHFFQSVITDRHFFLDQVCFWTKDLLPREAIQEIRGACGGFHRQRRDLERDPYMWSLGWKARYRMYQPPDEALRVLNERLGKNVLVNYVEPALDLITNSREDGRRLSDSLKEHMWQANRSRAAESSDYGGTEYSGGRDERNRFVIYADRPSKVTGEIYCVHVEYRVQGRRACAQKHIASLEDLISFDHRAFWQSRLRLAAIDLPKLERDFLNRHRSVKVRRLPPMYCPYPKANAVCNVAAVFGSKSADRTYQNIKAGWDDNWPPLSRYAIRIPNDILLTG